MNNSVKLAKFFERELASNLKEVLIVRDSLGKYELYGKYLITKTLNGSFIVQHIDHGIAFNEFYSLKNAVTWCTLHNSGKKVDSDRLQYLDSLITSLDFDIAMHKKILKSRFFDQTKMIYVIKLQEDSYKRRKTLKEIETYINSSKTVQFKKFDSVININIESGKKHHETK